MIGRYLAAFPWELSAKLTGKGDGVGKTRDLKPGEDLDILEALLPPAEAAWIGQARSRPLLLLGAIRRVLTRELRAGSLPSVVYRKLDEDLKELDLVVGIMQLYRVIFVLFALAIATADADPCLAEDYAESHYSECCAQGKYKEEGHKEICMTVGPKVKAKKEL